MPNSYDRSLDALSMLGEVGEIDRIPAVADIHPSSADPDQWVVWALDPDGAMLEIIFAGPSAEQRATEYAEAKFTGLRRCSPRPPQYR